MEDEKQVKVGIADLNLVFPPGKIMTIGLGSCIGISLYDKDKMIAGLAHIMLPDSKQFRNVKTPFKFADLAIPILIERMERQGCDKKTIIAKIAGGASMFNFSDKSMVSDIGGRNALAVKETLKREGIPLMAEEIGGNKGRTMIVESNDGVVIIKVAGKGILKL